MPHDILSSEWVVVHLLSSIWITNMAIWNSIQLVGCCAPSGLHLNHWHALMISHPGCELLCTSQALFKSLTCLHEILSRLWVVAHLLGSIWITNISSWNPIQNVSCCAPYGLHLNHWYASMKFYPDCELHTFLALFESLTCLYKILSSLYVVVHLMGSIWITDMPL